jgi:hypothetical protein
MEAVPAQELVPNKYVWVRGEREFLRYPKATEPGPSTQTLECFEDWEHFCAFGQLSSSDLGQYKCSIFSLWA